MIIAQSPESFHSNRVSKFLTSDRPLTAAQAARRLGWRVKTVHGWSPLDLLKYEIRIGHLRNVGTEAEPLIPAEDIDAHIHWIESRFVGPHPVGGPSSGWLRPLYSDPSEVLK